MLLEWGRVLWGSSLAHLGRLEEGITEMRHSLNHQLAMRCLLERPFCLTLLAEALLPANRCAEALALCDEALELGRKTEGRSYEAETQRVRQQAMLALAAADRRAVNG